MKMTTSQIDSNRVRMLAEIVVTEQAHLVGLCKTATPWSEATRSACTYSAIRATSAFHCCAQLLCAFATHDIIEVSFCVGVALALTVAVVSTSRHPSCSSFTLWSSPAVFVPFGTTPILAPDIRRFAPIPHTMHPWAPFVCFSTVCAASTAPRV